VFLFESLAIIFAIVPTTTVVSSWFNRTLQSAIPSKVFYTSLYSGLQSTKIHRDGLRLWSRDTFSIRDELRLWSLHTLFRDELKLGSRVTLSLNLTVYAKILHAISTHYWWAQKLTCWGTLRQVFICLSLPTVLNSPHPLQASQCLCLCTVLWHREGEG
jgi:hypothetical protein